jgi:hypothetical protein
MLSKLTDDTLRARVMTAVCSQGPILTLQTFAQDILLLLFRVHRSMTPMVKNMKARIDSIRRRICASLEIDFENLSSSSGLFVDTTIREKEFVERQKKEFVERCYQYVFLHTIRNKITTKPIDITPLSNLARREFNHVYVKEGNGGVCSPTENEDAIITRATADADLLLDWEVVEVSKRHGSTLFKKEGATKLLSYDQVHTDPHQAHTDPLPEVPITSSFMATHIVRVFLLGAAANYGAQPQPVGDMSDRLPFCNSSPASSRAFDGSDFDLPLYAERGPSPIEKSVPRYSQKNGIVAVSLEAAVSSKTASIHQVFSPISPNDTSKYTAKRPLPTSTTNEPQNDRNSPATSVKRRQLTATTDEDRPVSEPGSAHLMGLVTARDPFPATTTVSPSIYSSDAQVSRTPCSCGTGREDTMPHNFGSEYDIIGNPFSYGMSAGMSSVGQISSVNVSNYGRLQYPKAIPPSEYRSEQDTAAYPPRNIKYKKQKPLGYVVYLLSSDPEKSYRALRDRETTDRFVKKQILEDRKSTFTYEDKGGLKNVSNDDLYKIVGDDRVKVVLVTSPLLRLASLE